MVDQIFSWAVKFTEAGGYPAACGLMALESMIAPIPSEAVMPPLGMLVQAGKLSLFWCLVATSIGSIIGSLLSYAMGYWGGRPAVLKFGKYLLLNERHLDWTDRWFHRHGGKTIFIGRFIPVVRHLISIPAGTGRMPLLPFCAYTLAGATIWNGILLGLGMWLQDNWTKIQEYRKPLDYAVMVLLVAAAVYFYVAHLRPAKKA